MLRNRHITFAAVLVRAAFAAALLTRLAACTPSAAGTDDASGAGQTNALTGSGPITPQINSQMCLDVAGGASTNGTAVQIARCSGNHAQKWSFAGHRLHVFGNKCLDVVDGQTENGTRLQIWDCSSEDANQNFELTNKQLVWVGKNKCVDIPYGRASDGTPLQIYNCVPTDSAQVWDLTAFEKVAPPSPPSSSSGTYTKLVWSDEFTSAAVDTSKWTQDVTCAPNNNEQECYTNDPANAQGDGQGHLVLNVIKTPGLQNGRGYTSARLQTQGKGDWSYGRFEMRAKMPQGQGFWPAFWMMPSSSVYGTWPISGELDISEVLGNQVATTYGTAHYGLPAPYTEAQGVASGTDLSADFHVYALERDAHQIRWYFDGKLFYTLSDTDQSFWPAGYVPQDNSKWPFNQNFYLILNVAMGGDWPGAPDPSITSGAMTVDYVRVYQ